MQTEPIQRGWDPGDPRPQLLDYRSELERFDWSECGRALSSPPLPCGFNMAALAVDRHAHGANKDRIAIRWLSQAGELTYRVPVATHFGISPSPVGSPAISHDKLNRAKVSVL